MSSNVWKDHSRSERTLTDGNVFYWYVPKGDHNEITQEAVWDELLVHAGVFSLDAGKVNELMNVVLSSLSLLLQQQPKIQEGVGFFGWWFLGFFYVL